MIERRKQRSANKDEALKLLMEAVRERSEVSSVALVDTRGFVVSGAGPDEELWILGAIAAPVASGTVNEVCECLTEGTDVISRGVSTVDGTIFIAALGDKVSRMTDAVRAVSRIMQMQPSMA